MRGEGTEASRARPGAGPYGALPNGFAAASIFLGAIYAGYVVSPLNLLAQDTQLAYMLAHSRTRLVFAAPEFGDRLRALLQDAHGLAVVRETDPDSQRERASFRKNINRRNATRKLSHAGQPHRFVDFDQALRKIRLAAVVLRRKIQRLQEPPHLRGTFDEQFIQGLLSRFTLEPHGLCGLKD